MWALWIIWHPKRKSWGFFFRYWLKCGRQWREVEGRILSRAFAYETNGSQRCNSIVTFLFFFFFRKYRNFVVRASTNSSVHLIPLPFEAAASGPRCVSCYTSDDNTAEYLRDYFLEGGLGCGGVQVPLYLMTRLQYLLWCTAPAWRSSGAMPFEGGKDAKRVENLFRRVGSLLSSAVDVTL